MQQRESNRRTDTNNYYFLLSPIHQKILDFENRIRGWRFFRRPLSSSPVTHHYRSTSTESRSVPNNNKNCGSGSRVIRPCCFTSPMSRRRFDMTLSGVPRPTLDPVSTLSDNKYTDQEIARRYELIKNGSGDLLISGKRFTGVSPDDLETLCELGEGTCGSVSKCRLGGRVFAVKRMKRTDNEEESKRVLMDLDVLRKCTGCPHIIKFYGYIITFENLYICMEVMATCLEKLLQHRRCGFPEQIMGKITLSVVKALDYLKEELKLMHRDVKPSNILVDYNGNVKLCDFGISGRLIDSKAVTMSAGCAAYLAPERINVEGGFVYDVRADVWSLGITLVQLAKGNFPYVSSTPFELMVKIRDENPPNLTPDDGFSPEFCEFVGACLRKDMSKRPKYKDLLTKPFLVRAEAEFVDVGKWYHEHFSNGEGAPPAISH